VIEYKADGYLTDGFVNYLVRLGWSHGDQEIFTRAELESIFNLESIGKSPAVFDFQKLRWVNGEHIKQAPIALLLAGVEEFLPHVESARLREAGFKALLESLRERSQTLKEMAEACGWYFLADDAVSPPEKERAKGFQSDGRAIYEELIASL